MRRTWNTSVSPTIGMVTAGTGNMAFGPACAAAGALLAAAPASAKAPVVSMLRRSMRSMGVLLSVCWFGRVLDRLMPSGNPALDQGATDEKGPHDAGLCCVASSAGSVLDLRRQLAAIGCEFCHH